MDAQQFHQLLLLLVAALIGGCFAQTLTYDGCYKTWPNSRVDCLKPFLTQTVGSEQECRDLCTKNQPNCKSGTFISSTKICNLYDKAIPVYGKRKRETYTPPPSYVVQCTGYGPAIKPETGTTYFQPTGTCQPTTQGYVTASPATPAPTVAVTTVTVPSTTTTVPLPADATCSADQLVRYFYVEGQRLSSTSTTTATASSEQDCVSICTNNRLPDGTVSPCRSVDYNQQTQQCLISMEVSPPSGTTQLIDDPDSKHFEKVCVDSNFGQKCPGPYFRGPQKILIGFAQAVVSAQSAAECLSLCADSQARFSFDCGSVMFYYSETDTNCILNSETRTDHPDLYTDEIDDRVDYFEPDCTVTARFRRQASTQSRNRNVLVPHSTQFGGWTMCDHKLTKHWRYKDCPGMNPHKCAKEEQPCDPAKETEYDKDTPSSVSTDKPLPSQIIPGSSSAVTGAPTGVTVATVDTVPTVDPNGPQITDANTFPTVDPGQQITDGTGVTDGSQTVDPNSSTDSSGGTSTSTSDRNGPLPKGPHPRPGNRTPPPARTPPMPTKPTTKPSRIGLCVPLLNQNGTRSCVSGVRIGADGKRFLCVPSKTECS